MKLFFFLLETKVNKINGIFPRKENYTALLLKLSSSIGMAYFDHLGKKTVMMILFGENYQGRLSPTNSKPTRTHTRKYPTPLITKACRNIPNPR